jgi:hypothetical protein
MHFNSPGRKTDLMPFETNLEGKKRLNGLAGVLIGLKDAMIFPV